MKSRDRPPHMTVGSLKQFLTDIAETDGLSDDALVCFQSTEHGLQSVHGITLGEARRPGDHVVQSRYFVLLGESAVGEIIDHGEPDGVVERPTRN